MAARGTIFKILDDLERTVARCQDCRLALTRNKTVFGAGNPEAELVVFGEGPGEEEDQEGVPFVGRSGKLQARMLQTIGFDRTNTYILNVVKCRACEEAIDDKGKPIPYYNQRGRSGMRNRAPEMDEIKACRHFTDAQLKALPNKRLIICMGSVPAHWLLWDERTEKKLAMNGMRGKTFATIHGPAIVTYHPSYLLRSPHEKIKSYVDFRRAEKFLKEKRTEDELIEMLSHPALARERTQTYTALQSTRRRGSLKPFQNDPYSTTLKVI